jgi:REP element-mobilizing transposase RayT
MGADETPATLSFTRRNLPHWLVADRTYFVTIRLAGTIPRDVLRSLAAEREGLAETRAGKDAQLDLQRKQFVRIEKILDRHQGGRDWLTRPPVAAAILDALPWLEEPDRGWDIYAATLMSTHAHIVMRNTVGRTGELLRDLGQFKRHTARISNQLLRRTGTFWAREDFDHWCRTESKLLGAVRYTANNPVDAGLCACWHDWPWTRIKGSWVEAAGL